MQGHRQSRTESELSDDVSPPVPKRPSSSILECIRHERELEDLQDDLSYPLTSDLGLGWVRDAQQRELSPEGDDNMVITDCCLEPDYQEIDDNHESKYEPKVLRQGPPQVRIERKVFNPILHSSSVISSATGSEEMLDRQMSSGSFVMPGQSDGTATDNNNSMASLSPSTPGVSFLSTSQPTPASVAALYAVPHSKNNVSVLATLPRRKKDGQKVFPSRDYTIMDRRYLAGRGGDMTGVPFERSFSERAPRRAKPPTPPMRRLPSWVSQRGRPALLENVGIFNGVLNTTYPAVN